MPISITISNNSYPGFSSCYNFSLIACHYRWTVEEIIDKETAVDPEGPDETPRVRELEDEVTKFGPVTLPVVFNIAAVSMVAYAARGAGATDPGAARGFYPMSTTLDVTEGTMKVETGM